MIKKSVLVVFCLFFVSVSSQANTVTDKLENYFLTEAKFNALSLNQKKDYLKSLVQLIYAIEMAQGPHAEIQARIKFSFFNDAVAADPKNKKADGNPCLIGGWKSTYKNGSCKLPVKLRAGKFTCNNFIRPAPSELKGGARPFESESSQGQNRVSKSALSDLSEDILVDFRPTKNLTKRCLDAQLKEIDKFTNYPLQLEMVLDTAKQGLDNYFFNIETNKANKFEYNQYCAESKDSVCAAIEEFKKQVELKLKIKAEETSTAPAPEGASPAAPGSRAAP